MMTGSISVLAADLVCRSGNFASVRKSVLSHGVFCMRPIDSYIPIVIGCAAYSAGLIGRGYGEAYAGRLMRCVPDWDMGPLLAACFAFGLPGGWIGKTLLRKHFVWPGIA